MSLQGERNLLKLCLFALFVFFLIFLGTVMYHQ